MSPFLPNQCPSHSAAFHFYSRPFFFSIQASIIQLISNRVMGELLLFHRAVCSSFRISLGPWTLWGGGRTLIYGECCLFLIHGWCVALPTDTQTHRPPLLTIFRFTTKAMWWAEGGSERTVMKFRLEIAPVSHWVIAWRLMCTWQKGPNH